MMKMTLSIMISMIIATILGVYGQGMAYFMTDYAVDINPVYYLTGFTVISLLLYVVSFILASLLMKNKSISDWKVSGALLAISIIAVPISMFSFFVTAMWWG
ncbi:MULTISPECIES: hypothetical protein [Sporosarcina]|uniref:hypothetical protein n=1 Tax=Sporosarcina TaxID=1569 RepID=UPI00129BAF97|nr:MULTISPECIES: hypothetical protein [Sporosarcina]